MAINVVKQNKQVVWRMSPLAWGGLAIAAGLLVFMSFDGLALMLRSWEIQQEYSHGYMIPFITAFLIWQKKDQLEGIEFTGSWFGPVIIIFGTMVLFSGVISATHFFIQFGFFILVIGLAFSYMGWEGIKPILIPLSFLAFMIPLPGIFFFRLSSELQLISSQLGVSVIRLFDISVYLEGNIIDLGVYKLQVVEACSGLRYLFPMMSLAFIAAYFFKVALWKRIVVFLSSIPITILMNSFRIGVIGVLVEYWGIAQAEGFLHDFEGWVVFMASLVILLAEMWLLSYFGSERRPFRDVFGLEFPQPTPAQATVRSRSLNAPLLVSTGILIAGVIGVVSLGQREPAVLVRQDFSTFPVVIGEWQGSPDTLDQISLDLLKLDDYMIADYVRGQDESVNLYIAYYKEQGAGGAAHSPKTCLPGGGWRIQDNSEQTIKGLTRDGYPFKVNRVLIRKGEYTQLVYYWFQQRGRDITSEYMVKWHLLVDALKENRTDGALVRLVTMIGPGQDITDADSRLQEFAKDIMPELGRFIPN